MREAIKLLIIEVLTCSVFGWERARCRLDDLRAAVDLPETGEGVGRQGLEIVKILIDGEESQISCGKQAGARLGESLPMMSCT